MKLLVNFIFGIFRNSAIGNYPNLIQIYLFLSPINFARYRTFYNLPFYIFMILTNIPTLYD